MAMLGVSPSLLANAWQVLLLFLIPVGGGIPGGVVLAQKFGFAWQLMAGLYFISDVILAIIFEPLMLLFLRECRRNPKLARVREAMIRSTGRTVGKYGLKPGPFTLVWITFGTDPMTGRSVAKAAGHGFFTGWTLTIIGDMMFFLVLMASTLWLNNLLGDGTLAAIIVTIVMIAAPGIVRKLRSAWRPPGRDLNKSGS